MATRALDLDDILYRGGGRAVLAEDVTPADDETSDVFTGLSGAGTVIFHVEQRSSDHNATAPTMQVTAEHSADGLSWADLGVFDEIAGDGDAYLRVTNPLDRVRFTYAVTAPGRIHKLDLLLLLPLPVPDPAAADEGDVLTADGDGGYAWTAPAP